MVLSGSYRFSDGTKQTAFLDKRGCLTLFDEVGQLEIFPKPEDYLREVMRQKPSQDESDLLDQLSLSLGDFQQTEVIVKKKEQVLDPMAKSSAATKKAAAPKKAASNGKASAELNDCVCGCGAKVKNNFAPGHDAKVHSAMKKIDKGEIKLGSLPAITQKYIKSAHA